MVKAPEAPETEVLAQFFVGLVYRQKVEICDLYKLDRDGMRLIHNLIEEATTSTWNWDKAAEAILNLHSFH